MNWLYSRPTLAYGLSALLMVLAFAGALFGPDTTPAAQSTETPASHSTGPQGPPGPAGPPGPDGAAAG